MIYSRIKDLRKEHGLTQAELANKLGYDRSSISKIEKGLVDLSVDKVKEFAKILQCTPEYLMGWDTREMNGVGKSLEELTHNNPEELELLSINANIPLDLLNDIVDENYSSLSPELLTKIADYYNVGISYLLKYNTCRLSKEFYEYMDHHDVASIDNDSKLAAFLLTMGYELSPYTHDENKACTLVDVKSGKEFELSSEQLALFKRTLKSNIDNCVSFIAEVIDIQ